MPAKQKHQESWGEVNLIMPFACNCAAKYFKRSRGIDYHTVSLLTLAAIDPQWIKNRIMPPRFFEDMYAVFGDDFLNFLRDVKGEWNRQDKQWRIQRALVSSKTMEFEGMSQDELATQLGERLKVSGVSAVDIRTAKKSLRKSTAIVKELAQSFHIG